MAVQRYDVRVILSLVLPWIVAYDFIGNYHAVMLMLVAAAVRDSQTQNMNRTFVALFLLGSSLPGYGWNRIKIGGRRRPRNWQFDGERISMWSILYLVREGCLVHLACGRDPN